MKKTTLVLAALLAFTSSLCFGTIVMFLPNPQDDSQTHHELSKREELKPVAAELWDLVENRICPLRRDDIDRIFGPALSEPPKDMVLAIFAPNIIVVDGMGTPEFHAIGASGYIEFFYPKSGNTNLIQWGWFHRADDNFVPVRSADDFEKR